MEHVKKDQMKKQGYKLEIKFLTEDSRKVVLSLNPIICL